MAKDRVRLSKVTICAVGMLLIKSFLFVPYTAIPILYILFNFYPLPFVKSSFKYPPPHSGSILAVETQRGEGRICVSRGGFPAGPWSPQTHKVQPCEITFNKAFQSWKSSNSKDSAKQSHFHFHCMKLSARTQKVQLCTFLSTVLAQHSVPGSVAEVIP